MSSLGSFCTEFQPPKQEQLAGRRVSTSWDNEAKTAIGGLTVPRFDQRRNSNTLAQLLEFHRSPSLDQDNLSSNADCEEPPRHRADSRRASVASRRHSVGSRRQSVAEMLIDNGDSETVEDCVLVTQTLGTSTTLFFQKNPLVDNLDLRPSAVERGLYNFDNNIKEVPLLKHVATPRPSIQLAQPPKPSTLTHFIPSIDESDGEKTPISTTKRNDLTFRPSLGERGLPAMKFTPVLPNGQLPCAPRGRTLHKQPRADHRFDFELDRIIASRRKIIDEEETKRERANQIRPRTVQKVIRAPYIPPHHYDGKLPSQFHAENVMEELRNQMEGGEVDRIVKEKKTTTVSPSSGSVQNPNRRSITVEGSLPELLDRPYVRSQDAKQTPSSVPMKTVTIRMPPHHHQEQRTPIHRSATPSPHNTSDGCRESSTSA
uniref:Uncharacterized protein n=1 Tax=Caenorhabditis japonica TaxID=281687 RepID=A0A8R1HMI2_CAEJA